MLKIYNLEEHLVSILSHIHRSMKRNSNQRLKRCFEVPNVLPIIFNGNSLFKILYINHLATADKLENSSEYIRRYS